jgi:hypothetical protein
VDRHHILEKRLQYEANVFSVILCFDIMVPPAGFEPAAHGLGSCSGAKTAKNKEQKESLKDKKK